MSLTSLQSLLSLLLGFFPKYIPEPQNINPLFTAPEIDDDSQPKQK